MSIPGISIRFHGYYAEGISLIISLINGIIAECHHCSCPLVSGFIAKQSNNAIIRSLNKHHPQMSSNGFSSSPFEITVNWAMNATDWIITTGNWRFLNHGPVPSPLDSQPELSARRGVKKWKSGCNGYANSVSLLLSLFVRYIRNPGRWFLGIMMRAYSICCASDEKVNEWAAKKLQCAVNISQNV